MDDQEIQNLRITKRTLQEIYDICQQHLGREGDASISSAFEDISDKADYARSKVSSVCLASALIPTVALTFLSISDGSISI